MGFLNARVLDLGLNVLTSEATRLDICISEPADMAEATGSLSRGSKVGPNVSAPQAGTGAGRKVTIAAISDGSVSGSDTVTHWALSDTVGARLLAAGPLGGSQSVTAGNTFTLDAFDIALSGVAGG